MSDIRQQAMKALLEDNGISSIKKDKIKKAMKVGSEPKSLMQIIDISKDENLKPDEMKKKLLEEFKEYLMNTYSTD